MGSNFAYDLAEDELGLGLEQSIEIHLRANHYPPVPSSMVKPCIEAIDAFYDEETDREIPMPEGITYKGLNTAPAWAIVEQHHLDEWLPDYL